jgi:hypothetical protein
VSDLPSYTTHEILYFIRSNTNEGTHWSAELHNPAANTSEPNATEDTVFNFLAGQWPGLTRATFARATSAALYPQTDFANFSLQGQQLYGEMRFICTAILITGTFRHVGLDAFGYQCVLITPRLRMVG